MAEASYSTANSNRPKIPILTLLEEVLMARFFLTSFIASYHTNDNKVTTDLSFERHIFNHCE